MKIFYHNDLDGRCAGAIVHRHLKNCEDDGTGFEYIEMDYNFPVPVERIQPNEQVVIVDFSFKPEVMEAVLKKTQNIIWIDHHKTILDYKYSKELDGIRDTAFSGAELAWKYFFPNEPMPRAVELIGDRDTWKWKFGDETMEFTTGMGTIEHAPKSNVWNQLFENHSDIFLKSTQRDGQVAIRFRNRFCADYCDSYGFETKFEEHKAFACGLYNFGSLLFGNRMDKYDICLSFVFDGKQWQVGLYSKTIDVSQIAKKRGGGGHTGAAGFVCNELPFKAMPWRKQ